MPETHIHDIARVIQLALAPAFLLTAIASMLNVFASRLARIVDRTRAVESQGSDGEDEVGELEVLRRRAELVRWALTFATWSALLITLVIGAAFVGFLMQANLSVVVAGLFVAAMGALTLALVSFLREVTVAVGSMNALLPGAILRARQRRPREEAPPGDPPRSTP